MITNKTKQQLIEQVKNKIDYYQDLINDQIKFDIKYLEENTDTTIYIAVENEIEKYTDFKKQLNTLNIMIDNILSIPWD